MTIQQETKAKVQSTEAGAIPGDWRAVPFRHVVGTYLDYRGRTPKKLGLDWGGGEIVALSANNVQMGFIDFDRESYLGDELLYSKWMTNGDCELGDVLLTMEAPLGNVAQVPDRKRYILSQRVILVRPSPDVCKDFLAHQMRSERFQRELVKNASGSTALGIQRARLDQIPIALPLSTSEQKLISVALTEATALVDSLEQLLTKKRQIKKGAMQELLTGKRRLPVYNGAWDEPLLGDLLQSRPDYGINAPAVPSSPSLPMYLRITDIDNEGRFLAANPVSVDRPDAAGYYLRLGEIVFARTGASVGKSYLYRQSDGPLVFAGFLIRVQPDPAKLVPEYLFYFSQTQRYWNWVTLMSMRSGQPGINSRELTSMPVLLPRVDEQRAIASVLSDMDAEITALESRLTKARALKQAMAQALLTGRIRIPLSPREPAVPVPPPKGSGELGIGPARIQEPTT